MGYSIWCKSGKVMFSDCLSGVCFTAGIEPQQVTGHDACGYYIRVWQIPYRCIIPFMHRSSYVHNIIVEPKSNTFPTFRQTQTQKTQSHVKRFRLIYSNKHSSCEILDCLMLFPMNIWGAEKLHSVSDLGLV